jgi:hypothetical protein
MRLFLIGLGVLMVLSGCSSTIAMAANVDLPLQPFSQQTVDLMQAHPGIIPGKPLIGMDGLNEDSKGVFKIQAPVFGSPVRKGQTIHVQFAVCNTLDEPATFKVWMELPTPDNYGWYPQFAEWKDVLKYAVIRDGGTFKWDKNKQQMVDDGNGAVVPAGDFKYYWLNVDIPADYQGTIPSWLLMVWFKNENQQGFTQYVEGSKVCVNMMR